MALTSDRGKSRLVHVNANPLIHPPQLIIGTDPEAEDVKWIRVMNITEEKDQVVNGKVQLQITYDELVYHYKLHGHANKIAAMRCIQFKMSTHYVSLYKSHQEYLYYMFRKHTFKSQHELNHNYTLMIHCVTNPNGPQIWRKAVVNGRLTLKQLDDDIQAYIGYVHRVAHLTEFRFNLSGCGFSHKLKAPPANLDSTLVVFDPKHIDDYADGRVYRLARGNCTPPIRDIYFGQVADLYLNRQTLYTQRTVPFDPFYEQYYRGLNAVVDPTRYTFIDSKANFSFIKNDCFQFAYDWGEEWVYNVYVLDKSVNEHDAFFSHFVSGKGAHPPNDVGGMSAYKWILRKLHYEPHALKKDVGEFKTQNEVYEWLMLFDQYSDYWCLMEKDARWFRELLIDLFNRTARKKLVKQLQSGRPFLCPYRPVPDLNLPRCAWNVRLMKRWNRMLSRYNSRGKRCVQCGNAQWRMKRCRRCRSAPLYCSRTCQKLYWKSHHRVNCRRAHQ